MLGEAHRRSRARASGFLLALALGVPSTGWAAPAEQAASTEASEALAPGEQDELGEEPQTAAQWYERGVELGSAEQYELAAEAFLRSYELKPTSEALFNAAVARENAKDPVAAVRAYRRFLAEPERNEELAQAAERSVAALLAQVGTLKDVRYDPARPPAKLMVNGETVLLDGFPVVFAPGQLEVRVVDEQGLERSEVYTLAAGDSLILDLRALLPEPEPEPEPKPEPPPPQPPAPVDTDAGDRERLAKRARDLRVASFGTLGVAGASGIAALTLGLLATSAQRRYEEQTCFEFPMGECPEGFEIGDPELQRRNYERYALGTTVMVSVTAGVALAALVTGTLSIRYARASRSARVELRPHPGGFALRF